MFESTFRGSETTATQNRLALVGPVGFTSEEQNLP